MLLPDQTYEQASLRQEARLRVRPFGEDDGGFPRLYELPTRLDAAQLQLRFGREELALTAARRGVLANNEMKFGVRSGEECADGSGSSGVGSSGDGKHQTLDVRLSTPSRRDVGLGAESRSHTLDARCRSRSGQRAPPSRGFDQPPPPPPAAPPAPPATASEPSHPAPPPKGSRSDQTDRGIGLGSTSSAGSGGLSYSSDSSDEGDRREGRRRRRRSSDLGKPPAADGSGSWTATGPDQGERDNDYDKTSDFFNNIPEFQGEALGPFSIAGKRAGGEPDWGSIRTNVDVLRACELFLMRHRMRPDFFCKYKTAMNPSASAPASFPLSRSRTPIDVRKPKSVSPPMQRPASRAHGLAPGFSRASAATPAGDSRPGAAAVATATAAAAERGPGPIYSVPNRAGKKRRPNADASSSNEAVHLQQRLKSLSSELVTLRNRLHTGGQPTGTGPNGTGVPVGAGGVGSPGNGGPNTALNNSNNVAASNHNGGGGVHGVNNNNNNNNNSNNNSNNHGTHGPSGLMVGGNGINVLPHMASNGNGCPGVNNNNNNMNNSNNNNNNNSNNNNNNNTNNHSTNNVKNHMLVTSAAQCIAPSGQGGNVGHNLHASQPNVSQSGLPLVSPRNTSIPYPLPHHNSSNGGPLHHGDTIQCGGTLPRRTAMGFGGGGAQYSMGHIGGSIGSIAPPHTASTGAGLHNGAGMLGGTGHGHQQAGQLRDRHDASAAAREMDDLIHLPGPLTEDAVMRTLHNRFNEGKYFTNVGPILLSVNPYHDVGNPLTLSSTRSVPLAPQLRKIVQEAVRQQAETGYPQAIILSGTSGSGKTHCSMLLLRQLFAVAGGGPETDAFKHLAAAFTVLRSLGSAKTATNSESSRIGQFIEVQVTDGALYRTKIHCYFLDQTRVIRPLPNEKNYHIFYQMLAGLNADECARLNLEGYSPANLRYLQHGDIRQDEQEDAARFQAWKACLGILGIPFLDVVRVLAAVLLLGNVQFIDGQGLEVEVVGETELNAVANLLGVPPAQLFRGLTTRTHNARGQLIKSVCDANMSNMTRDCLAKALYCRTVATIVRRANSLKRLGSTLGTLSSDSNESVHNQAEVASQHASTIGGNAGSKSMAALNNAVRHATDGFIGILDMFGFEEPRPAQLEHLCINLCAETMQHFYNTHIFKSSVESCREEGIICDTEVDYVDNVPCIDLISSLRTGLLSMLDAECSVRGTAESYVAKIKVQHRNSARLEQRALEPYDPRLFAIRHFAGRVEYDTTDFLDTNRDVVPDDLVSVFYKHTCNFGFATHLFGTELKALYAQESGPRGLSFRIAPTSHTDLLNGDEPVSTLTQDFHTRLDNLLRTLVHARPHFVRCIRSNTAEKGGAFDRGAVVRQIRALQVLETVNLMASGFPHRMRFKQFTARYRMLAPFRLLRRCEEKALEDCKVVLDFALENPPELDGSVTLSWAPGKRHIFLSEGIRQHLERLRTEVRMKSATLIQATWRGWNLRKRLGTIRRTHDIQLMGGTMHSLKQTSGSGARAGNVTHGNGNGNTGTATRPRPQPIAGTPPPDPNEKCDSKIIAQTCTLFGLDLERPPPVPPSRSYTVTGNSKLGYPQTRIMKMNFPEDPAAVGLGEQLRKGEAVTVTGASHRRGHLIVEHNGISLHVPFQYMELVKSTIVPPAVPPPGAPNGPPPAAGAPAPPPPTAAAVNI